MDKHEIQCICSTFFEHIKENRVLQPENVGLFYLKQYISDFHIFVLYAAQFIIAALNMQS